jgi:hypothetical protein
MMDIVEESEISSLSDSQEKALSLLPFAPAILSILGSSTIIYMVVAEKKQTPYRRLLLGMSVCDILFSVTFPLQAFLLPRETSQRVWAVGSDASCSALGFFSQLSFSAMLYNGLLSHFFLLTIRFGWKEGRFAKIVEPLMHSIAIGFPLVTATVGAALGVYHEVELGPGCWVSDYPQECALPFSDVPCTSPMIAWIFGGSILVFVFISLVCNNITLYWHVRSTISKAQRRSSVRIIERDSVILPTENSNNQNDPRKSRRSQADPKTQRIRAVATQAFLYVAAFVLSYIWTAFLRIMESMSFDAEDEAAIFPLLVVQACFTPTQGFFNLLVYIRPRYLRERSKFGSESRWWCFKRAMFGDEVHPHGSSNRSKPERTTTTVVGETSSPLVQVDLDGKELIAEGGKTVDVAQDVVLLCDATESDNYSRDK